MLPAVWGVQGFGAASLRPFSGFMHFGGLSIAHRNHCNVIIPIAPQLAQLCFIHAAAMHGLLPNSQESWPRQALRKIWGSWHTLRAFAGLLQWETARHNGGEGDQETESLGGEGC